MPFHLGILFDFLSSKGTAKSVVPPLGVTAVCLMAMLAPLLIHQNPTPFSAQEWYWSFRDGYAWPLMIAKYFQQGGLDATTVALGSSGPVSFTAEEWYWAMRDGYLGNMVTHFMHNGGL